MTNAQLEGMRECGVPMPGCLRLPLGAKRSPKRPLISPDLAEPYGISAGNRKGRVVFRQVG